VAPAAHRARRDLEHLGEVFLGQELVISRAGHGRHLAPPVVGPGQGNRERSKLTGAYSADQIDSLPSSLVDAPGRRRSCMRLTKVTITNYRCIDDSGPVEVGDVTCLVGKNESGKTAFLEALRRLNPVDGPGAYDDVMDYPAKGFALYKRIRARQPAKVVRAVFELDDSEVARIEEDFGAGVLRSRVLPISKPFPPGSMTFGVEVNEAVAVRHLTKSLVLPEGRGKTIRQLKNVAKLVEALDAIEAPDPSVAELRQQIASWRAPRLALKLIDDYLDRWLPRFFYFDKLQRPQRQGVDPGAAPPPRRQGARGRRPDHARAGIDGRRPAGGLPRRWQLRAAQA
jgi:AAA ATPase domain